MPGLLDSEQTRRARRYSAVLLWVPELAAWSVVGWALPPTLGGVKPRTWQARLVLAVVLVPVLAAVLAQTGMTSSTGVNRASVGAGHPLRLPGEAGTGTAGTAGTAHPRRLAAV